MVTETFGEMLYYPESASREEFPSPEALKKRIILSTKPPKEYLESKIAKDEESESQRGKAPSDEEAWGGEVPDIKAELEYDDKVRLGPVPDSSSGNIFPPYFLSVV